MGVDRSRRRISSFCRISEGVFGKLCPENLLHSDIDCIVWIGGIISPFLLITILRSLEIWFFIFYRAILSKFKSIRVGVGNQFV